MQEETNEQGFLTVNMNKKLLEENKTKIGDRVFLINQSINVGLWTNLLCRRGAQVVVSTQQTLAESCLIRCRFHSGEGHLTLIKQQSSSVYTILLSRNCSALLAYSH